LRYIEEGNVAVTAVVVVVGNVVVRERKRCWAHSSAWIEWLPAEQLVEGSSPSGPAKNKKTFKKWTQLLLVCFGYSVISNRSARDPYA
jgi:L-aminopeptidase/D-esterase-like protein